MPARPVTPSRGGGPDLPSIPSLPLFREAIAARPALAADGPLDRKAWVGNVGLWYDKFCNNWAFTRGNDSERGRAALVDENGKSEGGKRAWIATVTGARGQAVLTGDASLLRRHRERQAALIEALGGKVDTLTTSGRMVSGLGRTHPVENGFAWHHALGVPYLAGSGIKGMARAWAMHFVANDPNDPARIDRIFGPAAGEETGGHVGSVIFFDALPIGPVRLVCDVMTPHYGDYYRSLGLLREAPAPDDPPPRIVAPADWLEPTPIPFLVVKEGAAFQFGAAPRPGGGATATKDCTKVMGWIEEALAFVGAGAKTAVGYGRFERRTDAESARAPAAEGRAPGETTQAAAGPTVGARGYYEGMPVEIVGRRGDRLVVRYLEEEGEDMIAAAAFAPARR